MQLTLITNILQAKSFAVKKIISILTKQKQSFKSMLRFKSS